MSTRIIARKPDVVIVDELAHTNVPGSRHQKRYQDVEEIVGTGINVITAINIQHVESLNALMKRVTSIDVRETVPDSFLARADQIVNIDVPVEALRERLREGKIYPRDRRSKTRSRIFSSQAISPRCANWRCARSRAASIASGSIASRSSARAATARTWSIASWSDFRPMPPTPDSLLRKASRIAGQLNAEWFAVHIETPSESVKNIGTKDFVALLDNINVASDLGAETVWLKSDDVVKALHRLCARQRSIEGNCRADPSTAMAPMAQRRRGRPAGGGRDRPRRGNRRD